MGRARASIFIVAVLALVSCGSADEPAYRTLSGLAELPNETLEDWVSYSDAVVVVDITSEEGESELSPEEVESGEGMTVRYLTAEVGEVLWALEGRGDRVPSTIRVDAPGFLYSEGKKVPYVMEDGNRLDVGETYLMPIADFGPAVDEYDSGGWQPIGIGIQVTDQRLSIASDEHSGRPAGVPPAASQELTGLTIDAAAAKLSGAEPDPIAAKHADLGPRERFGEVVSAQQAVQGTAPLGPGER